MAILHIVKRMELPDCWVSAGFVRSKIWDVQHGYEQRRKIPDVDVIYFDLKDTREFTEKVYEKQLSEWMPKVPWSVKNQSRMHLVNGLEPFTSAVGGMAHFTVMVTALGVGLTDFEAL